MNDKRMHYYRFTYVLGIDEALINLFETIKPLVLVIDIGNDNVVVADILANYLNTNYKPIYVDDDFYDGKQREFIYQRIDDYFKYAGYIFCIKTSRDKFWFTHNLSDTFLDESKMDEYTAGQITFQDWTRATTPFISKKEMKAVMPIIIYNFNLHDFDIDPVQRRFGNDDDADNIQIKHLTNIANHSKIYLLDHKPIKTKKAVDRPTINLEAELKP